MPDVSKCLNNRCPLKDDCYRWRSIPSGAKQEFINFHPKIDKDLEITCEYFIKDSVIMV